jgi:branched-chain amino acid transport system ATP-binding protein
MSRLSKPIWDQKRNILRISELTVVYGRAQAVADVCLEVKEEAIVALIGSNGAGKTTVLKTISGLKKPSAGQIWFEEKSITEMSPQQIVRLGIAHVPEGSQVFGEMTVLENLLIGAYLRKHKKNLYEDLEVMYEHFPVLKQRFKQSAGSLSGGERQMLAVARAFMSAPRLMLMDEPSLGLAPVMVDQIASIIRRLNNRKISIILVEQNAHVALDLSHYCYVLETGKVILEGTSEELVEDENVKRSYLGL